MADAPEGWTCVCVDGPCSEFPCKSHGVADAPERIWLSETTDEIASEYGAHGRSLGDRPEVEYVRADLYAALEQERDGYKDARDKWYVLAHADEVNRLRKAIRDEVNRLFVEIDDARGAGLSGVSFHRIYGATDRLHALTEEENDEKG